MIEFRSLGVWELKSWRVVTSCELQVAGCELRVMQGLSAED